MLKSKRLLLKSALFSKLTTKTPERRQLQTYFARVSIVDFGKENVCWE